MTMQAWWWAHKQGLDGTLAGTSAAEVLERTEWARSVGGVGPYFDAAGPGGNFAGSRGRCSRFMSRLQLAAALM
jgi:hypothetical protein